MLVAEPLTARCLAAFEARRHAVIGVSPFNSYFSTDRIEELARWGRRTFESVHVFVPDEPAAYTLEGAGYSGARARAKAARQANYLGNKIRRALAAAGVAPGRIEEVFVPWERVSGDERFLATRREIAHQYERDVRFRRSCREMTLRVLRGRSRAAEHEIARDDVDRAVRYLLAELPVLIDSVGIFGRTESVFCYHEAPALMRDLYGRRFDVRIAEGQGFVRIRPRAP